MPEFQFDSIADFLAMGGYGLYVWVSYGFFAVVMGINLWLPRYQRAQLLRLLKARQSRQPLQDSHRSPQQQAAQQQQTQSR